ncbi:TetR/AcrR family transcriptional regulator [Thermodesulfobacteriota bacterium]
MASNNFFKGLEGAALKKRQAIIDAASLLFAVQGFEATTTMDIIKEANATEPLIYYHFKGKDELYTRIIESTFTEYFSRLERLENDTDTQFEKIENLIDLHFQFVDEMPEKMYLAASTCPAKLKDPKHICAKNIQRQRKWMTVYLTNCLKQGIQTSEFHKVPIKATVNLLLGLINGLLRQRSLRLETSNGMKKATVDFCRRGLVKRILDTDERG